MMPRSLYPLGKDSPLGLRTGLEAVAKRKKLRHCSCWESNPGRPARIPVIAMTELPRLLSILGLHLIHDGVTQAEKVVRTRWPAILMTEPSTSQPQSGCGRKTGDYNSNTVFTKL